MVADTVRASPTRPDAPPASSADRPRRLWIALILGWAAHVVLRVAFALGQSGPAAAPDEYGYLFGARVLTGGYGADLSYGTVYRGGYPLLLSPAYWIFDDPGSVYQAMLVINALVSALMLPLGYLLLRRLGLGRGRAYLFANVLALLPAVLFFSEFVLTDAILPVVVLGWLLLAHTWLAGGVSPRTAALCGAGASALAVYAYVCHTRGLLPMLAQLGLIGLALLFRWRPWWTQAVAAAVLGAALWAGTRMNESLLPTLYPRGDNDLSANVETRLTSLDGWGWTLGLATGQLWCLLALTGGVAGVGLCVLVATAVRRGVTGPERALALAVLGTVVGIALATSAALPDEQRVGNYAYARYLAMMLPILFALGVAALLRASRRTVLTLAGVTAVLLAVSAGTVDAFAGERLSTYTFFAFDFPEASLLALDWTALRLWPVTFVALAILGAVTLAVTRAPRVGPPLTAVGFAALGLTTVVTALTQISEPMEREYTRVSDLTGIVSEGARPRVAIDGNTSWMLRIPLQYHIWWTDPQTYWGTQGPPPAGTDLVIAAWDGRTPPERTWHGGAPAGWRVAATRQGFGSGWTAWVRAPDSGVPNRAS